MRTRQLVADIAYQQLTEHLSDLPAELQLRVHGIMIITALKVVDRIAETAEARGADPTREKGAKNDAADKRGPSGEPHTGHPDSY